jgi:hypothetical protein
MNTIAATLRFLAISGFVLMLSGCQRPVPPAEPEPQALMVEKDQYDLAWDETLEVLNEHYFIPDRQDRRAGLVVTHPTLSKQWFEFWRDDAQGSYQVCESSMHSIRRIVSVKFVPIGDRVQIQLTVDIERKNQPQRQITTSSGSFQAFREQLPLVETGQAADRSDVVTWMNIGQDVKLANYLLERIELRLPESRMEGVCAVRHAEIESVSGE